jgi:hypothetical protein
MVEVFINGSLFGNPSSITPCLHLIPPPVFIMPTSAELRLQMEKLAAMHVQQEAIEHEEQRIAEEQRAAEAAEAERVAEARRAEESWAMAKEARCTMKAMIARRVELKRVKGRRRDGTR